MTRIIRYSNENGSREGVYFTEQSKKELPAEDVIPHGCTIDGDDEIDADMPSAFPLEYNLERTF